MEALSVLVNFEADTRGMREGAEAVSASMRLAQIAFDEARAAAQEFTETVEAGQSALNEYGGNAEAIRSRLASVGEELSNVASQQKDLLLYWENAGSAVKEQLGAIIDENKELIASLQQEEAALNTALRIQEQKNEVDKEALTLTKNLQQAKQLLVEAEEVEAAAKNRMAEENERNTRYLELLGNATEGISARLQTVRNRYEELSAQVEKFNQIAAITDDLLEGNNYQLGQMKDFMGLVIRWQEEAAEAFKQGAEGAAEQHAALTELIQQYALAITVLENREAFEEARLERMVELEKATKALAREEALANAKTTQLVEGVEQSGRTFNLSAYEITQWVQILRTGNVTQGVLTQGVGRFGQLLARFTPLTLGWAAALGGVAIAGYQVFSAIKALRDEFSTLDDRVQFATGSAIDLTGTWDDLTDTFSSSVRELNRVGAEIAILGSGLGVDDSQIEGFARRFTASTAALADATGRDAKEVQAALTSLLRGNTSAYSQLTGRFLESDAVIREALRQSGKLFAEYLTAAEIALAGVTIAEQESASSVVDAEATKVAALQETARQYLENLQLALASNTGTPDTYAIADFLDEQGIEVASRSVEDLIAAIEEYLGLLSSERATSAATLRMSEYARAIEDAEMAARELTEATIGQGSRLTDLAESIARASEAAAGGDLSAQRELSELLVQFANHDAPDAVAAMEAYRNEVVANGRATEQQLDQIDAVIRLIRSGQNDWENLDAILAQISDNTERLTSSQEDLIDKAFSLTSAIDRLNQANADYANEPTAATALAQVQALAAFEEQARDSADSLVALVGQAATWVSEGKISEQVAWDLLEPLGILGPTATNTGNAMAASGNQAVIAATQYKSLAEAAAAAAASLAVARRIVSGSADALDRYLANNGPLKDQIRIFTQLLNGINSVTSGWNGVTNAVNSAGSAVKSATDLMREGLERVSSSLEAAINKIRATRSLADAEQNLNDLLEEQAELPDQIANANDRWLQSVDDLAAAQARLTEEQQKSIQVTNAEQVAIEDLQRKLLLAKIGYENGQISAAKLGAVQDELNQAIEDSTAPTREEERARSEVERLIREEARAQEEMNDLKDRAVEITRAIEDAELAILEAQLAMVDAQMQLIDAGIEWMKVTGPQLDQWKEIARLAGLTKAEVQGIISAFGPDIYEAFLYGPGAIGGGGVGLGNTYAAPISLVPQGVPGNTYAAPISLVPQGVPSPGPSPVDPDLTPRTQNVRVENITVQTVFPQDEEMARKTAESIKEKLARLNLEIQ